MLRILIKTLLWIITIFILIIVSLWIQDKNIVQKFFFENQYFQYACQLIKFSEHCFFPQKKDSSVTEILQKRNLTMQFDVFYQWYTLSNYKDIIQTPSLYYQITGSIASSIPDSITLSIMYHKDGLYQEIPVIVDKKNLTRYALFSKEQKTMEKGMNNYIIQVKENEKVISVIPLQLYSQIQEIPIGDSIIYMDLSYQFADDKILKTIPSFDGHVYQQITYGCVEENPYKIVVKHKLDYIIVDACLIFDEYFQKILVFEKANTQFQSELNYNVYDINKNLLYQNYPLYVYYYDGWYQNFIAYEDDSTLGIYQVSPGYFGNNFYYAKITTGEQKKFEIFYNSIGNVLIKNIYESLLISLYSTGDKVDTITHPGLYYSYLPHNRSVPIVKKSGLIYPKNDYSVGFSNFGKPTRNLSFMFKDAKFIIQDGIKEIIYSITDLKTPLSINNISGKSNMQCNDINLKILSLDGNEKEKGSLQNYFLIGKGIIKSSTSILYESITLQSSEYGDYFSILLQPNISLKKGRNTYTVQLKDIYGNIFCEKKISLLIQ